MNVLPACSAAPSSSCSSLEGFSVFSLTADGQLEHELSAELSGFFNNSFSLMLMRGPAPGIFQAVLPAAVQPEAYFAASGGWAMLSDCKLSDGQPAGEVAGYFLVRFGEPAPVPVEYVPTLELDSLYPPQ